MPSVDSSERNDRRDAPQGKGESDMPQRKAMCAKPFGNTDVSGASHSGDPREA
jgi:hypothetical protein